MKTSRSNGFTVVELAIVIAILALLAAIAIPNFCKAKAKSEREKFLRQANTTNALEKVARIGNFGYMPLLTPTRIWNNPEYTHYNILSISNALQELRTFEINHPGITSAQLVPNSNGEMIGFIVRYKEPPEETTVERPKTSQSK